MARRRKRSGNSGRIPFVTTFIEISTALMIYGIADAIEKGSRRRRLEKINAMGTSAPQTMRRVPDRSPAFDPTDELYIDTELYARPRNNRYAWRLNCKDGSAYGVYPENFETRDEYNEAIRNAQYGWREFCEDGGEYGIAPKDYETENAYKEALTAARKAAKVESVSEIVEGAEAIHSLSSNINKEQIALQDEVEPEADSSVSVDLFEHDEFHIYTYCSVELLDSHECKYYRTEDQSLKKGDKVTVPDATDGESVVGVIKVIERHMRFSVPVPINETLEIIGLSE